ASTAACWSASPADARPGARSAGREGSGRHAHPVEALGPQALAGEGPAPRLDRAGQLGRVAMGLVARDDHGVAVPVAPDPADQPVPGTVAAGEARPERRRTPGPLDRRGAGQVRGAAAPVGALDP